jgi:hypothetical protein
MIIKDRINNMLLELGVNPTDETEALEMANQLMDHFNKIVIETLIISLDDEKLAKFKSYMEKDSDEELDAHITELAAQIPGLQFKIEEAIQAEFETLKAAKAVLDK